MTPADFDDASAAWMANKIRRGCQIVYRCTADGCRRSACQKIKTPFAPHRCARHIKWTPPAAPIPRCSPAVANPPSVLTEHEDAPPEEIPVLRVIDVSTTTQTEAPPVLRRSRRLRGISATPCPVLPAPRRPVRHCAAEVAAPDPWLLQRMFSDAQGLY